MQHSKRNCYSVAVECLDKIKAAADRGEEIRVSDLNDVHKLVEKVGNPALAKFLKESADILSGRGHDTRTLPLLLFNYATQKNPTLSVWTRLKQSPGSQFVLNVFVTLALFAIIMWLHLPPPSVTVVVVASMVHLLYLALIVVPETCRREEAERQVWDPLFWYSRIEASLRLKPNGYKKELPGMVKSFMEALRLMPVEKQEERRRIALNFMKTVFPGIRGTVTEQEYTEWERVLEGIGSARP